MLPPSAIVTYLTRPGPEWLSAGLWVDPMVLGVALWIGVMWFGWKAMASNRGFWQRLLLTVLAACVGLLGALWISLMLLAVAMAIAIHV